MIAPPKNASEPTEMVRNSRSDRAAVRGCCTTRPDSAASSSRCPGRVPTNTAASEAATVLCPLGIVLNEINGLLTSSGRWTRALKTWVVTFAPRITAPTPSARCHRPRASATAMTAEFLDFSRRAGNDLSTPMPQYGFPGLVSGDQWCLCADRWVEAFDAGMAPKVVLEATHACVLEWATLEDLRAHSA